MTLESNIDYNLGVRAHLGDLGCCNLPEKFRIETKEANHIISLLTHRPPMTVFRGLIHSRMPVI